MRIPAILSLAALLLTGCDYNDFDPLPPGPENLLTPNTTLTELAAYYWSGQLDLPDEEILVGGIVTTSDSAGNFYKTIHIQQGDQTLEILTGLYETYASYPKDGKLVLKADGLRLGRNAEDGVLQLGAPEGSGVGYINSEVIFRRITGRSDSETIAPITIPTLKPTQVTRAMAGRLVRVTGGEFTQGGEKSWSGEKTYSESRGKSIAVYTSPYSTFASDLLPEGPMDLVGIVTMYRDKVQLKISSTDDVYYTDYGTNVVRTAE